MDTSQWPQQGIGIVEQVENSRPNNQASVDKKLRPPPKDQAVNCPRCNSTNTKFCYYNNYSLSQPRYLCKTCRRYWTAGGSLRNVPVGGGSRKNKRPHSSSNNNNSSSINSKKLHSSDPNFSPQNNPNKIQQGQDLNLAYNPFQCNGMISSEYATLPPFGVAAAQNTPRQTDYHERQGTKNGDFSSSSHEFSSLVPSFGGQNALRQADDRQHGTKNLIDPQNPNIDSFSQFSMMELLKSGSRGLLSSSSSFMSVPVVSDSNTMFSSGLSFTLDGVLENESYGNNNLNLNLQNDATNSSRMVLPFEELKHVSSSNDQFEQDKGQAGSEANGSYWNGMLTGGSW